MGLIYNNLKDVQINAETGISFGAVQNIYAKMLSNDMVLSQSSIMPGIWCNPVYSDPFAVGYAKGDAVWINTEDINDFITAYEQTIIRQARFDTMVSRQFDDLSSNAYAAQRRELCRQLVLGYEGRPPMYYLGDLSKPVQIRISTKDNNTALPTDDSCWKNFFTHYDPDETRLSIFNLFQQSLTNALDEHVMSYHLSGIYNSSEQIAERFLLNDMSNLSGKQTFTSHYWYSPVLSGYDQVKAFYHVKYGENTCKWFRIWQSGLLEHGGIVDCNNPSAGDSFGYGIYTVKLDWQYADSKAPVYDYPQPGFQQFYDIQPVTTDGQSVPDSTLGKTRRYSISVSPLNCCSEPYGQDATGKINDCASICFIDNNRFGLMLPNTDVVYSYYVKGYSQLARKF